MLAPLKPELLLPRWAWNRATSSEEEHLGAEDFPCFAAVSKVENNAAKTRIVSHAEEKSWHFEKRPPGNFAPRSETTEALHGAGIRALTNRNPPQTKGCCPGMIDPGLRGGKALQPRPASTGNDAVIDITAR